MSQPLLYQLFSRSVSILWRSLLLRGEQSEGQIYNAKLWTHFLATFMRFLLRCHSLSPQQPTGQGCGATSDPASHFATSSLKRESIRSPGSREVRLWSLCVINTSSSFFFSFQMAVMAFFFLQSTAVLLWLGPKCLYGTAVSLKAISLWIYRRRLQRLYC